MKVPPRKPHFFKPVQPGFKHGLKLPIGFLKYLKGRENEHAVLRRVGKKWLVKLNGHRFKEGWEKFVEENDLELGNILVFKHEGDMEFEVTIFDSSHCERECELPQQGVVDETEQGKEKPESYTKTSVEAFFKAGVTKDMHLSNPHFICTIRPYCLSANFMSIPIQFARENKLRNRRCMITMTDEQRSWTFSLLTNGGHTYFGRGWREFCSTNCLKEGDRLVFEIVSNGDTPLFRFYDLRRNDTEKPESSIKTSVEAFFKLRAKEKHLSHPHFVCTIRPYCLSLNFLVIPKQFARENQLNNRKCTINMRDEQRSWTFGLHTNGPNTYFGRGWREFCITNCLKEGDRLMFEIVSNGETPEFRFYDLRGNAPLQPGGKKTNLDVQRFSTRGLDKSLGAVFGVKKGNRIETSNTTAPKAQVSASTSANANPHFISTIQPYSIDHNYLHLPTVFVKTNGLFNRRCEMILIDEKWRSWSVHLRPMSHHTGINRGWKLFKEANDVQVGDTFKFELISNEQIPVVYFHCKYAGKDAPGIREALNKLMEQLMMDNGKEP